MPIKRRSEYELRNSVVEHATCRLCIFYEKKGCSIISSFSSFNCSPNPNKHVELVHVATDVPVDAKELVNAYRKKK